MAEFTFEIVKHIGEIQKYENNWTKELNIVKWGEYPPKYDIRDWNLDHTRMKKGVTFTEEELVNLKDILNDLGIE